MRPALFIIPGSFAPSTFYVALRERVQSLGYDSYILPLQTVGLRPLPAPVMLDDAAFIATEVQKLVDKEQEVVLLAHSYGGVPMSQSTRGLSVLERADCGLKGGIKHLIYSSAIVPAPSGSLVGNDTSGLPPAVRDAIANGVSDRIREIAALETESSRTRTSFGVSQWTWPTRPSAITQLSRDQLQLGYLKSRLWLGTQTSSPGQDTRMFPALISTHCKTRLSRQHSSKVTSIL